MARKKKASDTDVSVAEGAASITLKELSERYLAALEGQNAGPGTIASYGMELRTAMKFFGDTTPIAELTEARVKVYFECDLVMKTRGGKEKAPPTYLKSQRVMRQALIWAEQEKLIAKAPIPVLEAKA